MADTLPGIAIIPESLIAVLTITMVVGMTQMRKRKVVIRKLSALEALGGVTNICSDKTGTLTQGQMITRKVWLPNVGVYTVEGAEDASDPTKGTVAFTSRGNALSSTCNEKAETVCEKTAVGDAVDVQQGPQLPSEMEALLQATALCNLATVRYNDQESEWQSIGDPTEIALQVFAHRFGHGKKTLTETDGLKELAEYPFDSSIKRMSVIYKTAVSECAFVFTKGAVERVLELCTTVGIGAKQQSISEERKQKILE